MKKTICLLLLALALCLCACSNTSNEPETPSESSSESTQTDQPQTIHGIWYSAKSRIVLDLRNLSNVSYYLLKVGFYQYEQKMTADFTYQNGVLKMELEDGDSFSWIFDANGDTLFELDTENSDSYVRKDALPEKYVSLSFPDFSKLNAGELVTLGKTSGLEHPTSETLKNAVDSFASMYGSGNVMGSPVITDRISQMGDYVNVDYKGFLNDVAFEGGEAKGADILIDSNSGYIPGFAEGIAGHTVGSTFDVIVTFPSDYQNTDLAGEETVFTMTLNAIYDLRGAFFWDQMIAGTSVESFPEESYAYFLQSFEEFHRLYAYYYGMDYALWLSMNGLTQNDLIAEAKSNALNYLAVYAIVEKNQLEITQDIIDRELAILVDSMMSQNEELTVEEAKAYILEHDANPLHAQAARSVAINWLLEQNQMNG